MLEHFWGKASYIPFQMIVIRISKISIKLTFHSPRNINLSIGSAPVLSCGSLKKVTIRIVISVEEEKRRKKRWVNLPVWRTFWWEIQGSFLCFLIWRWLSGIFNVPAKKQILVSCMFLFNVINLKLGLWNTFDWERPWGYPCERYSAPAQNPQIWNKEIPLV